LYINDILEGQDSLLVIQTVTSFPLTHNINAFGFSVESNYKSNIVLSDFKIISEGIEVFKETFDNTTKGTITGTEQYALIGTTFIPGILLEKKNYWTNNKITFDKIIEDYFFGGEFKVYFSSVGEVEIRLSGYDDKTKEVSYLGITKTTDSFVVFDIGSVTMRRLNLQLSSDNTIDGVGYVIGQL